MSRDIVWLSKLYGDYLGVKKQTITIPDEDSDDESVEQQPTVAEVPQVDATGINTHAVNEAPKKISTNTTIIMRKNLKIYWKNL